MEARRQGLIVRSEGRNIEVSNGLLLVRFIYRDGGYAQEFHATNAKGEFRLVLSSLHKDIIPASEHRVTDSPAFSGARAHLFTACRESLRMAFSEAQLHRPDEGRVVVRLSGMVQGNALAMRLTIAERGRRVRCEVENALAGPRPVVEYLMSSYAFLPGGRTFACGEEPEFTWAPNLRPTNDAIIGDLAFFSPAAIVQHGRYAAALIPDVDLLSKQRPIPASLDLDASNGLLFAPLLSYGFCDYEPAAGGRYFRHDITHSRRLDDGRLSYAFDLIVDADCKRESMAQQAARFIWRRYGAGITTASGKPANPVATPALTPDAQSAYGLYTNGQEREARAMRDSVLGAPRRQGLFATRFDERVGAWRGCRSPESSDCYSTAECSEQMCWLLRMHEDLEEDAETLAQALAYGDFLIEHKMRSGAIPAWYDSNLLPEWALRSGAPTAASAAFLMRLARITGTKKYLEAAASAARFVIREVIPQRLYLDGTFLSTGGMASLGCADPHTGMQPQSAKAMLWCAEMCNDAYHLFRDRAYLTGAMDVLDSLCLMQTAGDRPWMPACHGAVARGNTCAQADAITSAEFAHCTMRFGATAGSPEYCERAAAALRAAANSCGNASDEARVRAITWAMDRQFGALYVSVAGRWSVELNGCRLKRLDIQGTAVALDTAQETDARVVFAGLRARNYAVSINGRQGSYAREEMEAGIRLTA